MTLIEFIKNGMALIGEKNKMDFAYGIGYKDMVDNPEYDKNILPMIPNPEYQPAMIPTDKLENLSANPNDWLPMIPNPKFQPLMIPNPEYVDEIKTPAIQQTIVNPDYIEPMLPNPDSGATLILNPLSIEEYISIYLVSHIKTIVKEYRQKKVLAGIDELKSEELRKINEVNI